MSPTLLANVAATVFLTGMIATIHVVHYPLFAVLDDAPRYVPYMDGHRRRIVAVLLLPWTVEGVTSALLVLSPPAGVSRLLALVGLVLAGIPVVLTAGWAVAAHGRLASAFDADVHRRLMRVNALRVVAWTAHAAVTLLMLTRHAVAL